MENFNGLDLSKIPVVAPPPGQVSNFVDPPSQSVLVKAFTIVTLPPMVVLLVMRFHTRIRISGLGMDDYLCALAAVGIVAYVALCLSAIELSGGRHLWDIPLAKLTPTYVRLCNILANVYMVTAMLIKIALLIQYRRIFHPSPVANLLLWFGIVSTALIYIICMCILLAYCVPRPEDYPLGGWVSLSYSNRCRMPSAYVVLLSGILGTVIDIYVLTIPLAFLWGLKTTVKRKAGLSAIFLAGSAACIFSIVGVVYRVKMVTADAVKQDITWNTLPMYATSIGEVNIGIACSCMPIVFVLFRSLPTWSKSWLSKLRSITGTRHSNPSGAEDIGLARYEGIDQKELPQVPRGTMTGMRSFMRNFQRTKPTNTTNFNTELLTIDSLNCDYHEQLRHEIRAPDSHTTEPHPPRPR